MVAMLLSIGVFCTSTTSLVFNDNIDWVILLITVILIAAVSSRGEDEVWSVTVTKPVTETGSVINEISPFVVLTWNIVYRKEMVWLLSGCGDMNEQGIIMLQVHYTLQECTIISQKNDRPHRVHCSEVSLYMYTCTVH